MKDKAEEKTVVVQLLHRSAILIMEMMLVGLVCYAIWNCCQAGYRFCYETFGSVAVSETPGENRMFQVREGDTMYQVAKRLAKEDLIVGRFSFYARTTLMEREQIRLRPGSYVLNTSMDYQEIIDRLTISD